MAVGHLGQYNMVLVALSSLEIDVILNNPREKNLQLLLLFIMVLIALEWRSHARTNTGQTGHMSCEMVQR